MSSKRKGTNAERELIHLFWGTEEWTAVRVAGSGSMTYPAPDILANNATRQLAIECKTTRSPYQYLDKKEVQDLITFAQKSGATPLVAVRFSRAPWSFLRPEDLNETGKHYVITTELAQRRGRRFEEITKN